MADTSVKAQATQEFVPIKEVRDGIVILKDGSLRSLLMASSINLALKVPRRATGDHWPVSKLFKLAGVYGAIFY